MPKKYEVGYADELAPGDRKIVEVAGRSIGVFNVGGEYVALRNSCPHKAAPLCLGVIDGLVKSTSPGHFDFERDGEIIRCPWHGWEFDLKTGASVFNPHKVKVRNYPTSVELPGRELEGHNEDPSIETFGVTVEPVDGDERLRLYVLV